jgi:hypothetical protein
MKRSELLNRLKDAGLEKRDIAVVLACLPKKHDVANSNVKRVWDTINSSAGCILAESAKMTEMIGIILKLIETDKVGSKIGLDKPVRKKYPKFKKEDDL